jgi:glycosyltransferase involved in cell wall biosynthesis
VSRLRRMTAPSSDPHPWEHPFLSVENLERFHDYSEAVHVFASAQVEIFGYPRACTFNVNMAQNMYKWAAIAAEYGIHSRLIPHPMDASAISDPRWEDFNGEFSDLLNGPSFRDICQQSAPRVETVDTTMNGERLLRLMASSGHLRERLQNWSEWQRVRRGRYRELWEHEATYPYYEWALTVAKDDVSYSAGSPIASYATGKPYIASSVGGDLQIECGKTDDASHLLRQSFASAEFLLVSNPHTLGHSRRLGLANGVHVPYPMDDSRYSPGPGLARADWQSKVGGEVFVLTSARIDAQVKGFDASLLAALAQATNIAPGVRFVFLAWGESVVEFKDQVREYGLSDSVLLLPPVGKQRLIDYYRSCDIVLDQLVYGYFGASALEAMSVGKPVVMRLRQEQYRALYDGDVAPVVNVHGKDQIVAALLKLTDSEPLRRTIGDTSRAWVLKHHGAAVAGRKMVNIISVAAQRTQLPDSLRRLNPLNMRISPQELAYHASCQE